MFVLLISWCDALTETIGESERLVVLWERDKLLWQICRVYSGLRTESCRFATVEFTPAHTSNIACQSIARICLANLHDAKLTCCTFYVFRQAIRNATSLKNTEARQIHPYCMGVDVLVIISIALLKRS